MVAMKDIQKLADRIALEFQPDRVILFGSYSSGKPSPDSDVDLLVIMPHRGKTWRVAAEIRGRVCPEFPVDLLVRAPEEMGRRATEGDPFLCEILEKGQILYEADDIRVGQEG